MATRAAGETTLARIVKQVGDSQARFGANMRPVNERWTRLESPIFSYPYERSRAALEKLRAAQSRNFMVV